MSAPTAFVACAAHQRFHASGGLRRSGRRTPLEATGAATQAADAHRSPAGSRARVLQRALPRAHAGAVVHAILQLDQAIVALALEVRAARVARRRARLSEAGLERIAGRRTEKEVARTRRAQSARAALTRSTAIAASAAVAGLNPNVDARAVAHHVIGVIRALAVAGVADFSADTGRLTAATCLRVAHGIGAAVAARDQRLCAAGLTASGAAELARSARVVTAAAVLR
jgi:hypothetical protein